LKIAISTPIQPKNVFAVDENVFELYDLFERKILILKQMGL
jgi:hypothetical protein